MQKIIYPVCSIAWLLLTCYQIRKIAGCACATNVGTFFPPSWVSDPDMHHGSYVTHGPWCMPGSLTSGLLLSKWWKNVRGIPGAGATRNLTYLARGPCKERENLAYKQPYRLIHPSPKAMADFLDTNIDMMPTPNLQTDGIMQQTLEMT